MFEAENWLMMSLWTDFWPPKTATNWRRKHRFSPMNLLDRDHWVGLWGGGAKSWSLNSTEPSLVATSQGQPALLQDTACRVCCVVYASQRGWWRRVERGWKYGEHSGPCLPILFLSFAVCRGQVCGMSQDDPRRVKWIYNPKYIMYSRWSKIQSVLK